MEDTKCSEYKICKYWNDCHCETCEWKKIREERKMKEINQKKGHDNMEPSKDEIIKAIVIIRTGMTTNDIDEDDFNWAIHILQRAFRNGYSVVKTS